MKPGNAVQSPMSTMIAPGLSRCGSSATMRPASMTMSMSCWYPPPMPSNSLAVRTIRRPDGASNIGNSRRRCIAAMPASALLTVARNGSVEDVQALKLRFRITPFAGYTNCCRSSQAIGATKKSSPVTSCRTNIGSARMTMSIDKLSSS